MALVLNLRGRMVRSALIENFCKVSKGVPVQRIAEVTFPLQPETGNGSVHRGFGTAKRLIFTAMDTYIDATFSKDFTQHYSLLLEIEPHQFSFALYEKNTGRLVVLKKNSIGVAAGEKDFLSRLKIAITKEDLLHVATLEQKISFCFQPFTLVPTLLFEEANAKKYLEMSAPVSSDEHVVVNYIKKIFVKNVFSVTREWEDYLAAEFSHAKFFHAVTPLLEWALQNRESFTSEQIIVDVKHNLFHVLYFEERELKFCNQFSYRNKEDFLYFLLLVCDQKQIDRNHADLKLCGEIIPDSQLFTEFWKFFANISFTGVPAQFKLPAELEETPMHIYNTLLSLHVCE